MLRPHNRLIGVLKLRDWGSPLPFELLAVWGHLHPQQLPERYHQPGILCLLAPVSSADRNGLALPWISRRAGHAFFSQTVARRRTMGGGPCTKTEHADLGGWRWFDFRAGTVNDAVMDATLRLKVVLSLHQSHVAVTVENVQSTTRDLSRRCSCER